MPPRPSQGSGGGAGGASATAASVNAPPLPTLSKAPLPLEQLTQLQRRLAHLLVSLGELQAHVTDAQALEEWPALLSRHLTLVSQTHSLAQTLSLANPNTLNAQLAKRDEMLLEEAQQRNKYSGGKDDDGAEFGDILGGSGNDDALFGGKDAGPVAAATTAGQVRLPKVSFSSGDANPLVRLAPHPFYPIDADKAQTVIPSLLLPRGIDGHVAHAAEQRWQDWLQAHAGMADSEPMSKELSNASVDVKRAWIRHVREQIQAYDAFASQATRSLVHAREATDEYGQRYDWRTRIGQDEESDDEDLQGSDGAGMDQQGDSAMQPVEEAKKRKRAISLEQQTHLSLEQVRRLLKTGHP